MILMASYEFEHDWPLTPVTDPEILKKTYEITGVYPYPKEKQDWISRYSRQLYFDGKPFQTDELADEYDRRKADGTLDDVFK